MGQRNDCKNVRDKWSHEVTRAIVYVWLGTTSTNQIRNKLIEREAGTNWALCRAFASLRRSSLSREIKFRLDHSEYNRLSRKLPLQVRSAVGIQLTDTRNDVGSRSDVSFRGRVKGLTRCFLAIPGMKFETIQRMLDWVWHESNTFYLE